MSTKGAKTKRRHRPQRIASADALPTGSPLVCIKLGRQRQKVPPEVRARVFGRDNHVCGSCGARDGDPREAIFVKRGPDQWERIPQLPVQLTLDHIVPVSLGGCSHAHNLRLMCRQCNQAKGSEAPEWHKRRFG